MPNPERRILDDIEHPLIYDLALSEGTDQAVEKNPDAVVVHDIPLLAEVIDDIPMRFDHIVTVEAPEQTRVETYDAHPWHERGTGEGTYRASAHACGTRIHSRCGDSLIPGM